MIRVTKAVVCDRCRSEHSLSLNDARLPKTWAVIIVTWSGKTSEYQYCDQCSAVVTGDLRAIQNSIHAPGRANIIRMKDVEDDS